jgi:hypothetical protein
MATLQYQVGHVVKSSLGRYRAYAGRTLPEASGGPVVLGMFLNMREAVEAIVREHPLSPPEAS